jgi:hypothetical protein
MSPEEFKFRWNETMEAINRTKLGIKSLSTEQQSILGSTPVDLVNHALAYILSNDWFSHPDHRFSVKTIFGPGKFETYANLQLITLEKAGGGRRGSSARDSSSKGSTRPLTTCTEGKTSVQEVIDLDDDGDPSAEPAPDPAPTPSPRPPGMKEADRVRDAVKNDPAFLEAWERVQASDQSGSLVLPSHRHNFIEALVACPQVSAGELADKWEDALKVFKAGGRPYGKEFMPSFMNWCYFSYFKKPCET